jgi:hypothetical protein
MPILTGPRAIAINVKCRVSITTAYTFPAGIVKFANIDVDSHGAYNAALGAWTCPVAGTYLVTAALKDGSVASAMTVFIWKNGAQYIMSGNTSSQSFAGNSATAVMDLAVGDYIQIVTQAVTAAQLDTPAVGNYLHIQFLGGQTLTNVGSGSTPGTVMMRDANGRASVADPSASTDIATRNYVDAKYKGPYIPGSAYSRGDQVDYRGTRYIAALDLPAYSTAPTLITSFSSSGTTGGAFFGTVAVPAGTAAGDTVIMTLASTTALTFTLRLAGWRQVWRGVTSTPNLFNLVLTHVVTAGEVTAGNFGLGFTAANGQQSIEMFVFRGVFDIDWANVRAASGANAAGTTDTVVPATTGATQAPMFVMTAAFFGASTVNAINYIPAATASGSTGTQTDSGMAYSSHTPGTTINTQNIQATWTTNGANAYSVAIIPLLVTYVAPGTFGYWVAIGNVDVSVCRFRAQMQSTTAGTNIAVSSITTDNGGSSTQGDPLYGLGWDSIHSYWVCPQSGVYDLDWLIGNHSSLATSLNVYVSSVLVYTSNAVASLSAYALSQMLELNYGDVVAIQTSASLGVTAGNHYFTMKRIGPL